MIHRNKFLQLILFNYLQRNNRLITLIEKSKLNIHFLNIILLKIKIEHEN